VRHATGSALARIDRLLAAIRREQRAKERRTGIFYVKGQAFLHFHEDPAGIFADLKSDGNWVRFAVNTKPEQEHLLQSIAKVLTESQ
jgi:hypothetical protein